MQHGSIIRAERRHGPDVWEFRWRESGADGERKYRRMVLGSVEQLADETAARQAIATLRLQLNRGDAWLKTRSTTVSELVFRDPLVSATVAPASTRSALAPAVDTCAPS